VTCKWISQTLNTCKSTTGFWNLVKYNSILHRLFPSGSQQCEMISRISNEATMLQVPWPVCDKKGKIVLYLFFILMQHKSQQYKWKLHLTSLENASLWLLTAWKQTVKFKSIWHFNVRAHLGWLKI
jgi:hypothetical protein